jgi:chemotaxis protein CheY-P-specific phosphatase CheC
MQGLIKELQSLVRVLTSTLHPSAVQKIMTQIASTAASRLTEHYTKLPLTTSVSQHRIQQDVTYLTNALMSFQDIVVRQEELGVLHGFCANLPAFREK